MYTAASSRLSRNCTSSVKYGTNANSRLPSTISQVKGRRHTELRPRESKNAARKQDQREDEQRELDDRRPAHRHERRRQPFDEAERDPAQQRAGRIAEPAQ